MRKSGFMFGAVIVGALAAAAAVAPAVAQAGSSGTCGSSAGKCYSLAISPSGVAGGASASFTFTIKNEASTQQLGSVQINAPSGFVITSAPGSASLTSTSALFLNLAIAPTATTTLTVNATAPCSAGNYQWGLLAKQSNDFSGPPGNDFQLDPASAGNLAGTVTGSCSLAFSGEPSGTAAGHVISTGFNSSGGPVQVEVLDGTGHLVTTSTATISIGLASNPGSGSLSGAAPVAASGGVASFPGLSINAPGIGYALSASSAGIAPAMSTDFTIYGSIGSCSGACAGSGSSKTTIGSASTTGTTGDALGVGVGGVSYTCDSAYQPVSDPVNVDLLDATGKAQNAQFTATLEISKSAVQASGHTGASTWQVCYADTSPFPVRSGTSQGTVEIGGVTYYTGLLPDCSNSQPAPCVESRNKDNAGDVVITLLATGDLVFRG
jgi:hypothetical protein